jgi:targeting protein for Xklp2
MEDESDVVVFGVIDPNYEFSAPQYYDFEYEETQADVEAAERWFCTAITYEASPHVSKTKSMAELFTAAADNNLNGNNHDEAIKILAHVSPKPAIKPSEEEYADAPPANFGPPVFVPTETLSQADPCTPAGRRMLCKGLVMHNPTPVAAPLVSPLPAKRLYSEAWGASNTQVSKAVSRSARFSPSRHMLQNATTAKKPAAQNGYVQSLQDTQPRKKQKLDGGRLRHIPVVKEQKPKTPALTKTLEFHFCTETRSRVHATDHVTPLAAMKTLQTSESVQVGRAVASPFISMAEKVRRFQLKTPERFHMVPSRTQMEVHTEKPKMRLTRPKTPELETMQRARPPRVKSANEIEEEMLAKMPKFKARPLPKKILEAPSLPMLTKSTPQIPEFKVILALTSENFRGHFLSL